MLLETNICDYMKETVYYIKVSKPDSSILKKYEWFKNECYVCGEITFVPHKRYHEVFSDTKEI